VRPGLSRRRAALRGSFWPGRRDRSVRLPTCHRGRQSYLLVFLCATAFTLRAHFRVPGAARISGPDLRGSELPAGRPGCTLGPVAGARVTTVFFGVLIVPVAARAPAATPVAQRRHRNDLRGTLRDVRRDGRVLALSRVTAIRRGPEDGGEGSRHRGGAVPDLRAFPGTGAEPGPGSRRALRPRRGRGGVAHDARGSASQLAGDLADELRESIQDFEPRTGPGRSSGPRG
jgi:hypothetical protein